MTTEKRIIILAEGKFTALTAKTATGVLRYSPHEVVAVVDSLNAGRTVQDVLGWGGSIPVVARVADTLHFKPEVMVVGIAPTGGRLPLEFRRAVLDALENHLDVWSGLHHFLGDDEEFADMAIQHGGTIWDVRRPRPDLQVARGDTLHTRAHVCLMVGSDCNVGKMTTAFELQKEARSRGMQAGFVATGQTGILILGEGTPLDAIPGDFMPGEVERLVLQCDEAGDDVIFVEGQGALLHPGFGPVTLGLMLGAMPDSFILTHLPSRETYRPGYDVRIPPLRRIIDLYENTMADYKAPRVMGLALNTYDLDDAAAAQTAARLARETGLPTVDVVREGAAPLMDALAPLIEEKLASRRARPQRADAVLAAQNERETHHETMQE